MEGRTPPYFRDPMSSPTPTDFKFPRTPNSESRNVGLVNDLRKQISELLRYKEQCTILKGQVISYEEKEKQMKEEILVLHREGT
jgi:hypothetical protein